MIKRLQSNSASLTVFRIITSILFAASVLNFVATLTSGVSQDEQLYLLLSKQIVLDKPLYLSVLDHQPPGLAIAGVPFVMLFGDEVIAAKSAVLFYDILFALAISYIVYNLTSSRASFFVALAVGMYYIGFVNAIDPNFYAAAMLTIGFSSSLFGQSRNGVNRLFWSVLGGFIIGLAFMTKPSILFEIPALCAVLYLKKRNLVDSVLLLGTMTVSIILINLYFVFQGDWYEMLDVSVGENLAYIGSGPFNLRLSGTPPDRWTFFLTLFLPQTLPYWSGLLIAAISTFIVALRKEGWPTGLLLIIAGWVFLAFIDSALAQAMEVRYFSHMIAPLVVLFALSVRTVSQQRIVQWSLVIATFLLIVPFISPSSNRNAVLTHGYFKSDFQQSVNFLSKTLKPGECFLTWGYLKGLNFFSDYASCNRVAVAGTMMIKEVFDVDQMRSWYLSDTIQNKPAILAQQENTWGLFPALQQLVNSHSKEGLYIDTRLGVTYLGLNWANFYPSDANVNGEMDLLGYDILPGRHVMPGHDLSVTLYWNVTHPSRAEYQGFVHLLSLDYATQIGGVDHPPSDESSLSWRTGKIVVGHPYVITVPKDIPAGDYILVTGLYELPDGKFQALPHFEHKGATPSSSFITLQAISIP